MKDILKKLWNWVISITADKLLHDYVAALITLYAFVLLYIICPFWTAFALADAVAVLALLGKELYDYLKPEGHTVEAADVAYGLFGILKVDVALIILAFALAL